MVFSLRMQRCCCCCTVYTGSIIIATFGWIYTLISLFAFISPGRTSDIRVDTEEQRQVKLFLESLDSNTFAGRIVYVIIDFIVCALLLWGIFKKDHRFILPYLILQCINCIALTVITIIFFVLLFLVGSEAIVFVVLGFLILLITTLLFWYFWFCVWSHYKDLSEAGPHATVHYSPTSAPAPPSDKDHQQTV